MNKHQLSRRQFNAFSGAVSLALPAAVGMVEVLSAASVVAADAPQRAVKLRNSGSVPAIGQGSARLGQGRHPETAEEEALRTGISLGMSLIDTSGNYGNGRSEKLIGLAIAGQRDRVFLVSKVEANEVSGDGMARACQASLSRLGTKAVTLADFTAAIERIVAGLEKKSRVLGQEERRRVSPGTNAPHDERFACGPSYALPSTLLLPHVLQRRHERADR